MIKNDFPMVFFLRSYLILPPSLLLLRLYGKIQNELELTKGRSDEENIGIFYLHDEFIHSSSKKLATFNEVLRPNRIVVDGDELFIVEGTTIYIYSMKDYKLKKNLGNKAKAYRNLKFFPVEVQAWC